MHVHSQIECGSARIGQFKDYRRKAALAADESVAGARQHEEQRGAGRELAGRCRVDPAGASATAALPCRTGTLLRRPCSLACCLGHPICCVVRLCRLVCSCGGLLPRRLLVGCSCCLCAPLRPFLGACRDWRLRPCQLSCQLVDELPGGGQPCRRLILENRVPQLRKERAGRSCMKSTGKGADNRIGQAAAPTAARSMPFRLQGSSRTMSVPSPNVKASSKQQAQVCNKARTETSSGARPCLYACHLPTEVE